MSWDRINPVMDVKDGMHCNIPWPRLPSHLGHGILECIPSLISITGFILSQLMKKKPVAVTTAYSVPDDGRKGLSKHVELLTPNKRT